MKKLTALLFACMMITCTFTACGSKDDDDDDGNKKSTSASASAADEDDDDADDDDEDETEPATKKKKPTTTEADGDEDETEPATKKKKPTTTEADDDEDETEPATKKKKPTTTEADDDEDDAEDSAFVGKWECIKVVMDGEVFEDEINDVPIRRTFRISAHKNGKGYIEALGDIYDFEWKKEGKNKIEVIDEDDETTVFTINGNKMVCDEEGMEITFEKVKSFSED